MKRGKDLGRYLSEIFPHGRKKVWSKRLCRIGGRWRNEIGDRKEYVKYRKSEFGVPAVIKMGSHAHGAVVARCLEEEAS